ncbi:MaoC family dehydratase [Notoacmeibacter sp. MSK16QG-6]|uniref:MaoC family dehydratase n=1 Tax=Notoacmeibacter sp. MSK16QG-6 TaxID=2957982 RepID=UPI00209F7038|nr:MaoC family dehydratase [Notoacmeibacter sp. MSK16QG-6]MCP1199878.1 MaoC family dehydratase [Notoacmeibacter sp. MSK16QG-6]
MMETLFSRLKPGLRLDLGSYTFEAEAIKEFARKFDPQPFHLDEDAAERSHFGKLCASGWHCCAIFMKLNVANGDAALRNATGWSGPLPERGPSPGLRDLKWRRPTYAGDTLSYSMTLKEARESQSRPGWGLLQSDIEATNQDSEIVMRFISTVFIRTD